MALQFACQRGEFGPGSVQAGQTFEVSFVLRNTSTKTRVSNMKVTVASPDAAFLPTAGTSSLFIPGIRPGNYASRTMTFRALPSLEAKPYAMTISIEYEDSKANAYTSTENVAIEVTQELRASASSPQLLPEMLMVGQQGSLTFNIQNQGRSKLFNAKATIPEGQPITAPEVFVGTIEPGASGAVDMMVTAEAEAAGPVEILVTYEDDEGTEKSFTQDVQVMAAPMPDPAAVASAPSLTRLSSLSGEMTEMSSLGIRAARRRSTTAMASDQVS